jgi:transcriptional regulator with GAF, ATPase, and Fis domain
MDHGELGVQMAGLARDLRSAKGAGNTLQHVVDATVELIEPCRAAGISLAKRPGHLETSAFSDDVPRRADELQEETGQGPCMDAIWEHGTVVVEDLREDERWPRWGPRAMEELGVRSMVCYRLFTHEDRVGALNLFAAEPGVFTDDVVAEGLAIAAHAAVAVAAAAKVEGLEHALVNRTIIGQGMGLVMGQYRLSDIQAFNLLRRLSSEQNRKLVAVAEDIVAQHVADVSQER